MQNPFKHFYKRSYNDRIRILSQFSGLNAQQVNRLKKRREARSSGLIENYLTDYHLPEGVAVGFKINGHLHAIPMATEEPSVIAAASNGAGMLSNGTGIHARVVDRLLTGQIVIKLSRPESFKRWLNNHKQLLIQVADQAHPTIKNHGGGARQIELRKIDHKYYSLDLMVDVSEAMGANMMNSMLEAVADFLNHRFHQITLMSILSNYADHSLAEATGKVSWPTLATKHMSGKRVAQRIALASKIAQLDIHRAATHNKGIMNGVDAAVIAMGNDWRAVESGAQAFAARHGRYRGLSQWKVVPEGLVGMITLPLALGFVGGATRVLPLVKINQRIAQVHSARDLMRLVVSEGLAQNLAALRAIVTDGIQRGHMYLQMRSLAMSAGANRRELPQVTARLRRMKNPNLKSAQGIVKQFNRNVK